MEIALTASELLWDEQQRTNRAQKDLERRQWLKRFALVLVLITLTLTIATLLARWGGGGAASRALSTGTGL